MRKTMMFTLMVLLMVSLAPSAVFSAGQAEEAEPEEFKLGFLSSLSGGFAGVAETQRKSFLLAVEEKNAEGGLDMPWGRIPIETTIADDEATLDVGVRRFREMLDDGINALTGGIWNPMSAALNEESKINPVLYIPGYVPAIDMFTAGNIAPTSFTPTFTPWSIGYIAGQSIVEGLGLETVFFVERADSWGATILSGLEAGLNQYGGELVGTAQVPYGTTDYTTIINNALNISPDIFVTSMFGGDAIANLNQGYQMGLYDEMEVMNTWTANIVARGIPSEALDGLYALAWFYWDVEGLDDQEQVQRVTDYADRYSERWNEPPDNMGTASYVASEIIFEAVERAGSFDPEVAAEVVANEEFETVIGTISFREDQQAVTEHASYLLKGKSASERTGDWDFFHVINSFGGEEVLPPLSEMGF